jgi:hypothetical protein
MTLDRVMAFSVGIEDAATQRAVRALERAINAANSSISALQSSSSSGGVPTTRTISTVAPLVGGGSLASNLSLSISPGTNGDVLTTVGGSVVWAPGGGGAVSSVTAGSAVLTVSPTTGAVVVDVATNGISNAKFRQGVATSLVGRAANSTGNVADIVATADNQFPIRQGGVLAFADFAAVLAGLLSGQGEYGDGSDGSVTFDGTTTVVCNGTSMAPDVNGRYLIPRDMNFVNCTINAAATLIPCTVDTEKAGSSTTRFSAIYGTGLLTCNGRIRHAGQGVATNSLTGHGTNNGFAPAYTTGSTSIVASNGANGSGTGTPAATSQLTQHFGFSVAAIAGPTAGNPGANGGVCQGGAGGSTVSFAGGGVGQIQQMGATFGNPRTRRALLSGSSSAITAAAFHYGGVGGGGGAYGNLINSAGGQGGGPGGGVIVSFRLITGTGFIESVGGDGTNGNVNANNINGGGGGGGGGGGVVVVQSNTVATSVTSSSAVLGGVTARSLGGAAGLGAGTTGRNGGAGGNGLVFAFNP